MSKDDFGDLIKPSAQDAGCCSCWARREPSGAIPAVLHRINEKDYKELLLLANSMVRVGVVAPAGAVHLHSVKQLLNTMFNGAVGNLVIDYFSKAGASGQAASTNCPPDVCIVRLTPNMHPERIAEWLPGLMAHASKPHGAALELVVFKDDAAFKTYKQQLVDVLNALLVVVDASDLSAVQHSSKVSDDARFSAWGCHAHG